MGEHMEQNPLFNSSSNSEESSPKSNESNKKRKLPDDLNNEAFSPLSKQKIQNLQENAESSEDSNTCMMQQDWPSSSTSSSSSSNCSNDLSSTYTLSSDSSNNFLPDLFNHRMKEFHDEIEALDDPVTNEAVKNNVKCSGEDSGDSLLYSNGLNEFVLPAGLRSVGQEGRLGARKPTIDQEFEQYFSMLML